MRINEGRKGDDKKISTSDEALNLLDKSYITPLSPSPSHNTVTICEVLPELLYFYINHLKNQILSTYEKLTFPQLFPTCIFLTFVSCIHSSNWTLCRSWPSWWNMVRFLSQNLTFFLGFHPDLHQFLFTQDHKI